MDCNICLLKWCVDLYINHVRPLCVLFSLLMTIDITHISNILYKFNKHVLEIPKVTLWLYCVGVIGLAYLIIKWCIELVYRTDEKLHLSHCVCVCDISLFLTSKMTHISNFLFNLINYSQTLKYSKKADTHTNTYGQTESKKHNQIKFYCHNVIFHTVTLSYRNRVILSNNQSVRQIQTHWITETQSHCNNLTLHKVTHSLSHR